MNIIRLDNVKSALATTYSLTLNVEKNKDIQKHFVIVVLDEEDIENKNTLIKLKGLNIDVLMIPKKLKFSFNESEYFDVLSSQLNKENHITYY